MLSTHDIQWKWGVSWQQICCARAPVIEPHAHNVTLNQSLVLLIMLGLSYIFSMSAWLHFIGVIIDGCLLLVFFIGASGAL